MFSPEFSNRGVQGVKSKAQVQPLSSASVTIVQLIAVYLKDIFGTNY